jgi:hypothetical protein
MSTVLSQQAVAIRAFKQGKTEAQKLHWKHPGQCEDPMDPGRSGRDRGSSHEGTPEDAG